MAEIQTELVGVADQYISPIVVPLAGLVCDLTINGNLTSPSEGYAVLDRFYVPPLSDTIERTLTSPIFQAAAGDILYPQVQFDTPTDFTVSGTVA